MSAEYRVLCTKYHAGGSELLLLDSNPPPFLESFYRPSESPPKDQGLAGRQQRAVQGRNCCWPWRWLCMGAHAGDGRWGASCEAHAGGGDIGPPSWGTLTRLEGVCTPWSLVGWVKAMGRGWSSFIWTVGRGGGLTSPPGCARGLLFTHTPHLRKSGTGLSFHKGLPTKKYARLLNKKRRKGRGR